MNRDDIIRMAHEAGIPMEYKFIDGATHWIVHPTLERFAALVYEYAWKDAALAATHTVVDAAVLAEREECAKVCEDLVLAHPGRADLTADQCAAAIRARGEQ